MRSTEKTVATSNTSSFALQDLTKAADLLLLAAPRTPDAIRMSTPTLRSLLSLAGIQPATLTQPTTLVGMTVLIDDTLPFGDYSLGFTVNGEFTPTL